MGALLVPRLLAEGHEVRALARDPARAQAALAAQLMRDRGVLDGDTPGGAVAAEDTHGELRLEVVRGDVLHGDGLGEALDGVDVAYYLIHSMESPASAGAAEDDLPAGQDVGAGDQQLANLPFPERERIGATRFADAAREAGLARVVYLGGLTPTDWQPSRHLASREAVERILLDSVPDSLALRSSIVIGAGSRSFRLLVRLVERMPVLALPRWSRYSTQPIDGRDLVAMLIRAADLTGVPSRVIEVAGPEVLTYGQMMERIADTMLVRRRQLRLGLDMTGLSARVAAAITAEDPELTVSLMGALKGDLVPSTDAVEAASLFGVHLHSFDAAVEHALREWETVDSLAAR